MAQLGMSGKVHQRHQLLVIATLRDVYGLTPAEAHLAEALLAGIPVARYARDNRVALNTVYTHLRRLRERPAPTAWSN